MRNNDDINYSADINIVSQCNQSCSWNDINPGTYRRKVVNLRPNSQAIRTKKFF